MRPDPDKIAAAEFLVEHADKVPNRVNVAFEEFLSQPDQIMRQFGYQEYGDLMGYHYAMAERFMDTSEAQGYLNETRIRLAAERAEDESLGVA
jgi:hypothetical protein